MTAVQLGRRHQSRDGIAGAMDRLVAGGMPMRFEAHDGSVSGPPNHDVTVRLLNDRGLSYILTAPGSLGFARAYVAGDIEIDGVRPGDPYAALAVLLDRLRPRLPRPRELVDVLSAVGAKSLWPQIPPPQEGPPRWRRALDGLRHSRTRDAAAIGHHYDVSNLFYELLLGDSMTYSCAVFTRLDTSLQDAQREKYDLIARKLNLRPGDRLLDVGCGWGGMVRHAAREYGVKALGVTLSAQQAAWARDRNAAEGLADRVEVRHTDYRDIAETDFDAVSAIGVSEHIGVRQYARFFGGLRDRLRVGGRMLNQCITRRDSSMRAAAGPFIDRYIFPDGELAPAGTMVGAMHDNGLEVRHVEDLREHYALTLRSWSRNLDRRWSEAVAEVGESTAKAWGVYLAGSRLAFERGEIGLYQLLGVKTGPNGDAQMPLRPILN